MSVLNKLTYRKCIRQNIHVDFFTTHTPFAIKATDTTGKLLKAQKGVTQTLSKGKLTDAHGEYANTTQKEPAEIGTRNLPAVRRPSYSSHH